VVALWVVVATNTKAAYIGVAGCPAFAILVALTTNHNQPRVELPTHTSASRCIETAYRTRFLIRASRNGS
jgi:hypothetical protein